MAGGLSTLSHTNTVAHSSNESYLALLTEQLLVHPEAVHPT